MMNPGASNLAARSPRTIPRKKKQARRGKAAPNCGDLVAAIMASLATARNAEPETAAAQADLQGTGKTSAAKL